MGSIPFPHFSHTPAQQVANNRNCQQQSDPGMLLFLLLWSIVLFCQ